VRTASAELPTFLITFHAVRTANESGTEQTDEKSRRKLYHHHAPHPAVDPVSPCVLVLLVEFGIEGNLVMKQYLNSFDARQTLVVGAKTYAYYSLPAADLTLSALCGPAPITISISTWLYSR
jgi:hypothetical protein